MVGTDRVRAIEPERREPREQLALVRDRRGMDHVVRRDAVRGHEQQALLADGVDVSDLPAGEMGQSGGVAHCCDVTSGG
jgi:hypothetical protein